MISGWTMDLSMEFLRPRQVKTTVSRVLSNQPKLRMDVLIGMGPSNWGVT